ncbi:hypothetical protein M011DRAFT_446820 [Sporormia fimetaria CBS 119925]|uniref:Shugoshin n=1 Tax=Sporormia fimetaria CBS 119925 TaxID=1340428 RepID=A0A6A6V8J5_9PLEO|nr:hypothetical protein M011DRAFT_446820 [Sporormia fimetaria CBS 119925]
MARLNEPPVAPGPAVDSLEVVKRKFLRQNRELAKTNSQQSIRIRTLEIEVSRLLNENLSLREQVLQLQNALQKKPARPSFDDIDVVKDRLEAKLAEFGSLVAELGQLRKEAEQQPKSEPTATRPSPEERQWRSGLGLQAVESAMMPTIVEDKYFPRQTMGADELRDMLEEAGSQSPDIGPPPVLRFGSEETANANNRAPVDDVLDDADDDLATDTIETRRKRRESGPKLGSRRAGILGSVSTELDVPKVRGLRTGAKRKFSVQMDEERDDRTDEVEAFKFSRRGGLENPTDAEAKEEARPMSPSREVLRNKPVNTEPMLSPKKRSSTAGKPEKKTANSKTSRGRLTITRGAVPEQVQPFPVPAPVMTAEIDLAPLPPKTPGVPDMISPDASQPSNVRPEGKDTPPPGDLMSGDQPGQGARPSRRARPQVSYKEPSLATKMRRPGKELVDAVIPSTGRKSSVEPTSAIKKEPEEQNSAWKSLPTTAGATAEYQEPGSPLKEKLSRKEGGQGSEAVGDMPKLNSSAASNAISALISATSTAKRRSSVTFAKLPSPSSEAVASASSTDDQKDRLAIFDYNDDTPDKPPLTQNRPDSKIAKSSRRHSSAPTSTSPDDRASTIERKPLPEGALPSLHSRPTGTASHTRKASDPYSLNRSSSPTAKPASSKDPNRRVGRTHTDAEAKSAEATTTEGLRKERAERAASRRKSMML